ncbi:MAG: DUF1287 domain-containing protein [Deltaproteobacteria bacterium]|nr:DUF1287 domain-containing protein [Deltaproteobacteria bacterium]
MPFFKPAARVIFTFLFLCSLLHTTKADALLYTIKPEVTLREGPDQDSRILKKLRHNQTLTEKEKSGQWIRVRTLTGLEGFVNQDMVSDTWIRIYKEERLLTVMKGEAPLKSFRVALSPSNPYKDKVRQGDSGTPEGRFYICEMLDNPARERYGARSMRLSYPNIEDARRGLTEKLIDYDTYRTILKDIQVGKMPQQNSALGGSIRIHGGGNSNDWTLGCVALDDKDIIELFGMTSVGTRVEIYRNKKQDAQINNPDFLNNKILEGAKTQLKNPALYTTNATGLLKISYPMGDISQKEAVCTDIIIRALRHAGIDLQALVHEHVLSYPEQYTNIQKPDYNIDHRRTRNLQIYLKHNAINIFDGSGKPDMAALKPGDIVILDTGIQNGTAFDHIGIVDTEKGDSGNFRLINIWTIGYHTESMSLLGKDYPDVVGVFRLTHLFDYQ